MDFRGQHLNSLNIFRVCKNDNRTLASCRSFIFNSKLIQRINLTQRKNTRSTSTINTLKQRSPCHFYYTSQKMKFSIQDFFSKCNQIQRKPRIWSQLLKKSLTENFLFCAVLVKKQTMACNFLNSLQASVPTLYHLKTLENPRDEAICFLYRYADFGHTKLGVSKFNMF